MTTKDERSKVMMKIAELIDKNFDKLAKAESMDHGKPVWFAKMVDIPRASSNMQFYATGILHFASEAHAMEDTAINYTLREPIGVVDVFLHGIFRCIYLPENCSCIMAVSNFPGK